MKINKTWFTLVELIVVVSILAILSAIWFVSYSGYITWVRDTNRISQLWELWDSLNVFYAQNPLPMPDDYIDIKIGNRLIGYQWNLWKSVLNKIDFNGNALDPDTSEYFVYALSQNKKYFTLGALLENDDYNNPLASSNKGVYASENEGKYPYITWDRFWVIYDEFNVAAHQLTSFIEQWSIDIADIWSNNMKAFLSNTEILSGTWNALLPMSPNYDCKRILDITTQAKDWVYSIDPDGDNLYSSVYCDMTHDGWGWTIATMLGTEKVGTTQEEATNMFDTWVNGFVTSLTNNISDKGNLNNVWNDNYNRDLLFQCTSEFDYYKWYHSPFVIYNFPAEDKSHLLKTNKAGTTFSSKNLQARWKTFNYTLSQDYWDSSKVNSMYFVRAENRSARLFIMHARLWVWNNAGTTYIYDEKSPAYSADVPTWTTEFKLLTPTNYCYSAVRMNLSWN